MKNTSYQGQQTIYVLCTRLCRDVYSNKLDLFIFTQERIIYIFITMNEFIKNLFIITQERIIYTFINL